MFTRAQAGNDLTHSRISPEPGGLRRTLAWRVSTVRDDSLCTFAKGLDNERLVRRFGWIVAFIVKWHGLIGSKKDWQA